MSTLVVQADDAAISHATTLGILDAIDRGRITATGIFTNCENATFGAEGLRKREGVDVGLDLNFVTARPLLPPEDVPGLVDETGKFRTSTSIKADRVCLRRTGPFWEFDIEPFDEEQVHREAKAQLERFYELFDRPPAYLHHHSLVTPVTDRVLHALAEEHGIVAMDDLYLTGRIALLPNDWYAPRFDLPAQALADPLDSIESLIEEIRRHDVSVLITHPGYVDAELLDSSSYSVIRARDLQLLFDPRWHEGLSSAGITVANYTSIGLT